MNNDNVYMDIPQVDAKITALKSQRDIMKNTLEIIKDDILRMPDIWNGNTGDENYEVLVKYSSNFQDIINKIDEFIEHLQKARDSYEAYDKAVNEKINSNAEISAV